MHPERRLATRCLAALAAVLAMTGLVLLPHLTAAAAPPASAAGSPSVAGSAAPATGTSIRPAADLSQFRPGNIVSDAVFTNASTMSADQIQSFLQSKVPTCRSGYVCLKDFQQSTPSKNADRYCNGYSGSGRESAASIIAKVAQSCGINPQVLVVMLQKEQGLVLDSWPVGQQYAAAMGQACPDTAPCDPSFAGFFAQVYGGARQMKIYLEGVYFTWYAPGHTWNILYNPNEACGSSPVYIENGATSALYYYTPYQPNSAALAAGYGTGNGCSAYGNRNFFNFFTDWFGSTQTGSPAQSSGSLVVAHGDNRVYLVVGGTKHHVVSSLDLAAFTSRLGSFRWVDPATLSALTTGPDITRYVHDARTGTLYLLDGDGTRHRLPTAAMVAAYGYTFGSFVDLPATMIDLFPAGAEIGSVFAAAGSGDVYQLAGQTKRHVWDTLALTYSYGSGPAYIATMEPAVAAGLTEGATLFAPNTLVRAQSANDVYLTTSTSTIVHIPSFGLAADFGAVRYTVVSDTALTRSTPLPMMLSPVISCDGALRILDGSALRTVSGTNAGGVTPTALTAAECAAFPATSTAPAMSAPLFVQGSDGAVQVLENGKLRHILTGADLTALNGNRPLQIASWSASALQAVGTAPAGGTGSDSGTLPENTFVSFEGHPEVYRFSGGALHHVRSFNTLVSLGGGSVPPITTLPSAQLSSFTVGAPLLTENEDFVQFTGHPEVYRYQGGALRHVLTFSSLIALGNGSVPPILELDPGFLTSYTMGQPIP